MKLRFMDRGGWTRRAGQSGGGSGFLAPGEIGYLELREGG